MKRFERYYDRIATKIVTWASNIGKNASQKSNQEISSGKSIPHGTRSQLEEYKVRKKLLFKKMRLGAIAMCFLIIFLAWLQDYLPSYNRKFWSRGTGF